MGLLKLGSIYKKKSKKTSTPDVVSAPPLPSKIEPISLDLNLNFNELVTSPSSIETNKLSSNIQNTMEKNNNTTTTVTTASGSLFEDIFAELGTKSTNNKQEQSSSVFDNDFSLALALSQQLEIQDNNGMAGTTKTGSNMSTNNNSRSTNNNTATATATTSTTNTNKSTTLFGGDSIYSNYLKGLSALDNNDNDATTSSSLSTSMFDSILNKNSKSSSSNQLTNNNKSIDNKPQVVTQVVVLDSDISDSDEDSKNSDDSDDEYDVSNNGKTQRRTKGVKPIMERRGQDNRLLVQRRIDNWSNKVDPEANRAELNESMIARMKDRHRNQVKLAALRNQQQLQEDYNMMGYPQQQSQQHMVPQPYGAPTMMPLSPTNGAVLQHPGMLMDPVHQMYYPHAPLQQQQQQQMNDYSELTQQSNIPPPLPPAPIPAAFLPNPTHVSLAIPHPPKEEEENITEQQHEEQYNTHVPPPTQQHYNPHHHHTSLLPQINKTHSVMMMQSNNNSRTNNSTMNNGNARSSSATPPSSVSSGSSLNKTPSSSTVTIEKIDEIEEKEEAIHTSTNDELSPPVLLEKAITTTDNLLENAKEMAAEEADCEISGDEETNSVGRTVSTPKRKKSIKKLRQNKNDVPLIDGASGAFDSGYTQPQVVRSSRSTPNLKKNKKKSSSRNSSRRNSQDFATSPSSEMIATPPPLPNMNSPYINYNNNSEENLFYDNAPLPRSTSHQHQLQQQGYQSSNQNHHQHRQSLRHMKSEPDLPRRSNSSNNLNANNNASNIAYQQQKLFQQQQQLNLEWERMQNYQREQLLKQQIVNSNNNHQASPQPVPFMPVYSNMYYPTQATTLPSMMVGGGGMMVDPSLYSSQQHHQKTYQQSPAYNNHHSSSAPYQSYHQQPQNKYNKAPYHHSSTRQ